MNTVGFHLRKRGSRSSSVALPNASTSTVLISCIPDTRRERRNSITQVATMAAMSTTVPA